MICVSLPWKYISWIWVQGDAYHGGTYITVTSQWYVFSRTDMCFRVGETHFTRDVTVAGAPDPGGRGVLDISLDGEVRRGPSYPDPVNSIPCLRQKSRKTYTSWPQSTPPPPPGSWCTRGGLSVIKTSDNSAGFLRVFGLIGLGHIE